MKLPAKRIRNKRRGNSYSELSPMQEFLLKVFTRQFKDDPTSSTEEMLKKYAASIGINIEPVIENTLITKSNISKMKRKG